MSANTETEGSKNITASTLKDLYIEYVVKNAKKPASVGKLVKNTSIKEKEFYQFYPSVEILEKDIWKGFIDNTITRLYNADAYPNYSVREKLLGFYFTLIEELGLQREFVIIGGKHTVIGAGYLDEFKKEFISFTRKLVMEALATEEIYDRPVVSQKYNEALWAQLLFVLNFWMKDKSDAFEKTDEAIEKAVNLSFDLMAKNPLDSLLEFGKYLLKNSMSTGKS